MSKFPNCLCQMGKCPFFFIGREEKNYKDVIKYCICKKCEHYNDCDASTLGVCVFQEPFLRKILR